MSRLPLLTFGVTGAVFASCWLFAQEPDEFVSPPPPPQAEVIEAPRPAIAGSGIQFDPQSPDRLVVRRIVPDSRAALAGVLPGDVLVEIDDRTFANADEVETHLTTLNGKAATFLVLRDGLELSLEYLPNPIVVESEPVVLVDEPLPTPRFGQAGGIGIRIAGRAPVQVVGVYAGSPADLAGVLPGDDLLAVDGIAYRTVAEFTAAIAQHHIGEDLQLAVRRAGVEQQIVVQPEAWSLAFDEPARVLPGWEVRSRRLGCYRYDDDLVWADEDLDDLFADRSAGIAELRAEIRALRQELIETNARLNALQTQQLPAAVP